MRILYYNWTHAVPGHPTGGGVGLYQADLLGTMSALPGIEVEALSAGTSYRLKPRRPHWHSLPGLPPRHEIVNSEVPAPAPRSFGLASQIDAPATEAVLHDILRARGPFDIVHFNNLEGLPARALLLTERFPRTRVVLTLHNYYPFCPQVDLWFRDHMSCPGSDGGRLCSGCLPLVTRPHRALAALTFGRANSAAAEPWRPPFQPQGHRAQARANAVFEARRPAMVGLVNRGAAQVLCVSRRVESIARAMGIDPALLCHEPIGTKQAEQFARTEPRWRWPGGTRLHLGYLGYMRPAKGFDFLLAALEQLPPDLAPRIGLSVAARAEGPERIARLERLRATLGALIWHDGYRRDQLDEILRPVDLGVVPVLWEDCLPQVAIEMHARHIPLLTSHLGGAHELANHPPLVFEAGNITSFHDRLRDILEGRLIPDACWPEARSPLSMQAHAARLLALYRRLGG